MSMQTAEQTSAMDKGQVNRSAAEVYDEFFVPALFAQWADRVVDAAQIGPGHRTLDVACGTGVLARAAAVRTGDARTVVGVDINHGMLQVAERSAPQIEWRTGAAEELPFDDGSFDAVVSQFGLMFFDDRVKALQEMARVLRKNGRLAVAVWDALETTPGYAAMVDLLQRLFGDEVANGLRAPFALGNTHALHALCKEAGLARTEIETWPGTVRFPSLESWMYTDIRGWTLADSIDDAQFARLLAEGRQALARFVQNDGTVRFGAQAHIVTAMT